MASDAAKEFRSKMTALMGSAGAVQAPQAEPANDIRLLGRIVPVGAPVAAVRSAVRTGNPCAILNVDDEEVCQCSFLGQMCSTYKYSFALQASEKARMFGTLRRATKKQHDYLPRYIKSTVFDVPGTRSACCVCCWFCLCFCAAIVCVDCR